MIIDLRPRLSEPYKQDLIDEYDSLMEKCDACIKELIALHKEGEERLNTLLDTSLFASKKHFDLFCNETMSIVSKSSAYEILCREYIDRMNAIQKKLRIR